MDSGAHRNAVVSDMLLSNSFLFLSCMVLVSTHFSLFAKLAISWRQVNGSISIFWGFSLRCLTPPCRVCARDDPSV